MGPCLGPKVLTRTVNPNVGQLTNVVPQWKPHKAVVDHFIGCDSWKFGHFLNLWKFSPRYSYKIKINEMMYFNLKI